MDWKLIMRYCYNKENSVILSHGDWDHISFITQARYKLRKLCLHKWPKEKLSSSKKKTLTPIPKCHKSLPANIFEIHCPQKSKRPNYLSRVYIVNNKILIPGDSP